MLLAPAIVLATCAAMGMAIRARCLELGALVLASDSRIASEHDRAWVTGQAQLLGWGFAALAVDFGAWAALLFLRPRDWLAASWATDPGWLMADAAAFSLAIVIALRVAVEAWRGTAAHPELAPDPTGRVWASLPAFLFAALTLAAIGATESLFFS